MSNPAAVELLRQAMAAVRADDLPRTRQLLQEATQLDPRNETAWAWLAGVAETPLEATHALEKVVALNPQNDKAKAALKQYRLSAGIAAARAKDIPTARRLLRAVVADDPNTEQGWIWLASVTDSPYEAMAHLNRALAINPNNTAAKKGLEYYQNKLAKAASSSSGITTSGVVQAVANESGALPTPPRPARPPQSDSSATKLPTRASLSGPAAKKVLVIDASRTNRKLIGLTLAGDGYRLVEAADSSEAADRIREEGPPDLVVLDAHVPGMDVYGFCQLVRQSPETQHVGLVLIAGNEGLLDQLRGSASGVDVYLSKPFQPEALLQAARALVRPEPAGTA
jgi:CheY-like chemotaxis protein